MIVCSKYSKTTKETLVQVILFGVYLIKSDKQLYPSKTITLLPRKDTEKHKRTHAYTHTHSTHHVSNYRESSVFPLFVFLPLSLCLLALKTFFPLSILTS